MAERYKGKRILMETLVAEGVDRVFGNPGTTELPLMDSLIDYPQIEYVLALHEGPAVIMADAYAQATGKVGFANLHVGPGLGNGLGAVYNAWEGRTPLVVTAGQQDNRMRLREPLLGHDLVAMAAPLTKWAVEAQTADELPLALNRAFKTAREAPSGPVFVSLPMNVMEQETAHPPMAPSRVYPRIAADPEGVAEAAGLLLGAREPLIVCGDGVATSGAVAELVALAELLGATVYNEVLPTRVNFPTGHPHYRERGAQDQALLRKLMGNADVILLVGGEFFEEVWFVDTSPFPEDAALIQIDPAPSQVGRNYAVHCGLVADPKVALQALHEEIARRAGSTFHDGAEQRRGRLRALKEEEVERQRQRAQSTWNNDPMSVARLMAEVKQALPPDITISNESVTGSVDLARTIAFDDPRSYFAARGGGIGQGVPSGIGLKLAFPERPVMVITGDGSSLYTIQSLWTAAHHKIPVVFMVLNNAVYRILKINMNRYRSEAGLGGERAYPHLDLNDPVTDFVKVAEGFGVEGRRIARPEEVGSALREAFASGRPYLLDVAVDGRV